MTFDPLNIYNETEEQGFDPLGIYSSRQDDTEDDFDPLGIYTKKAETERKGLTTADLDHVPTKAENYQIQAEAWQRLGGRFAKQGRQIVQAVQQFPKDTLKAAEMAWENPESVLPFTGSFGAPTRMLYEKAKAAEQKWAKENPELAAEKARLVEENTAKVVSKLRMLQEAYPEVEEGAPFGIFSEAINGMAEFAPTMAITAVPGMQGLSFELMAAQIAGNKYDQLIKEGKDKKTAADAAVFTAMWQAPLEMAGTVTEVKGMQKIAESAVKKFGPKFGKYIKTIIMEGALPEGLEEGSQEIVDIIADTYANNPDADPKELAKQVKDEVLSIRGAKRIGRATGVGALGGTMMTGGVATLQSAVDAMTEDKTTTDIGTPKLTSILSPESQDFVDQLKQAHEQGSLSVKDLDDMLSKLSQDDPLYKAINDIARSSKAQVEPVDILGTEKQPIELTDRVDRMVPYKGQQVRRSGIDVETGKARKGLTVPGAMPELANIPAEESAQPFIEGLKDVQSIKGKEGLRERLMEEERQSRVKGLGGLVTYIRGLRDEVAQGEPGMRVKSEDYDGTTEWRGYGSTYPDFMKDKYTREDVLNAIDKGLRGQPFETVTTQYTDKEGKKVKVNYERQDEAANHARIWEDVLNAAQERKVDEIVKYAEIVGEDPTIIEDLSDEDYKDLIEVLDGEGYSTRDIEEIAFTHRKAIESRVAKEIAKESGYTEEELQSLLEDDSYPDFTLDDAWTEALSQPGRNLEDLQKEHAEISEIESRPPKIQSPAKIEGQQKIDGQKGLTPPTEPVSDQPSLFDNIDQAANDAATSPENDLPEPTEAQIEAGNYQKGHINIHGLEISIENPRGSTREGTDGQGKKWKTELKNHYGYIRRTEGKDGDQVDVFVGENPESENVFIVNQINPRTGNSMNTR